MVVYDQVIYCMHVNRVFYLLPSPLILDEGLCAKVVMMESVVLLFGVLVKSEPQCLK